MSLHCPNSSFSLFQYVCQTFPVHSIGKYTHSMLDLKTHTTHKKYIWWGLVNETKRSYGSLCVGPQLIGQVFTLTGSRLCRHCSLVDTVQFKHVALTLCHIPECV